jgi:tripartite-type tricarboxylate transporter receptor subunit TctC
LATVDECASYPSKPITIVVPFSVGGPTDTIARVIGEGLQTALGVQLQTLHRQGYVDAEMLAQMRAAKPLAPILLSWVPE